MEVIEFVRPESNRRNLFVSIPSFSQGVILDTSSISELLRMAFSPFGLLYEIQVFPSILGARKVTPSLSDSCDPATGQSLAGRFRSGHYAFVKLYSYAAARLAKESLNSKLQIGGQRCKVSFAQRTKGGNCPTPLHFSNCVELANFYLGFSGWSSSILQMSQDEDSADGIEASAPKIRFYCRVCLELTGQHLSTEGFGAWEESYNPSVASSRAPALAKTRKLCFQRAMEDAFSRVLLVVLPDGRVYPEVNTIKPPTDGHRGLSEQLLPVNELDELPEEEESDGPKDPDDLNLHLLQELEEV